MNIRPCALIVEDEPFEMPWWKWGSMFAVWRRHKTEPIH
jgi:hypothetical protein